VVEATSDTQLTFVTDPSFGGIAFCGETYSFYSSNQTGDFDEYKEIYFGQKNEEDFERLLTFNLNGSTVHNYVGDYSRFYIEDNVSNSGFLLANNVFNGNDIYSNTIGDRSYNNTGRYWFVRNTIDGRFYNNMIHDNGFYSNREDPSHMINTKNIFGQTPLYVACKHGNLNVVKILIT
jgi:ankyrin repeat protein